MLNPTLLFRKSGNTKLYIWNPGKKFGAITLRNLTMEQVSYDPIMD